MYHDSDPRSQHFSNSHVVTGAMVPRDYFKCARGLYGFHADVAPFIKEASKFGNSGICRGPRTNLLG